MLGGKNKQFQSSLGYTIIEVMIVLAVSGMMFIIAANFINGKQGKTAFTQGTHELASQIQNVIEQVSDGQFSDIPLTCSFAYDPTPGQSHTTVTPGASKQGTNSNCVFLGKLLRFYSSPNARTYRVLSLAAGRVTEDPVSHLPLTPTLQNTGPAVITDLTNSQTIPQNLSISSITVTDTNGGHHTDNYNFGFAEGLGTVSGDGFQSGSQTLAMIYSPSAAPAADGGPTENDATGIDNSVDYAKAVAMCMTDGVRHAQILIGGATGDASQLSVNVQVVPTC